MSPDELRVAVALAMGWTCCGTGLSGTAHGLPPWDHIRNYTAKQVLASEVPIQDLPELTLDWLHEAEKTLTDEEHRMFRTELWKITEPNQQVGWDLQHNRNYASASATSRAVAFLLAKGLIV